MRLCASQHVYAKSDTFEYRGKGRQKVNVIAFEYWLRWFCLYENVPSQTNICVNRFRCYVPLAVDKIMEIHFEELLSSGNSFIELFHKATTSIIIVIIIIVELVEVIRSRKSPSFYQLIIEYLSRGRHSVRRPTKRLQQFVQSIDLYVWSNRSFLFIDSD